MFGFVPSSSFSPYAGASGYSAPPRRSAAPTTYAYSPFGGFVPLQQSTASPPDPFGFDDYASPAAAYYDPYTAAARRAALERQALFEEQQRQAAAEEAQRRATLLRRRQQQAEEEEYIRRQLALHQAIEEEERARYRAAVKAAREEERKRREAIARRQEEILRRQKEEQEARRAEAEKTKKAVDEDDNDDDDNYENEDKDDVYAAQEEFVNPFFSWLYPQAAAARRHQQAQRPRPAQRRKQSSQPGQPKQDSPAPVPVVESVRSVSPTPESDSATFAGPTVEDVTPVDPAEAEDAAPAPAACTHATATAANAANAATATQPADSANSTPRPATPQPTVEQMEAAARAVQSAWKHHHQRQSQLTKLATLSAELDAKRDEFALPAQLDFEPPVAPTSQPRLAYSRTNAPFRGYEDALLRLLTKVDEVQSGGDREVKKARKVLVGQVEAELARLDAHKERLTQEWKDNNPDAIAAAATAAATATVTTPADNATTENPIFNSEDAEMTDDSADADAETSSTVSVDSIDAKVAMMEDLLTASKGGKVRRDGRAHSQRKRLARKSRKHREGARGVDRV